MLYAFLGSTLLGALSSALLLWRKSVAEKKLAESQALGRDYLGQMTRSLDELTRRSAAYEDQLARQRDVIETIRKQRDEAIDELVKRDVNGAFANLLRSKNVPNS